MTLWHAQQPRVSPLFVFFSFLIVLKSKVGNFLNKVSNKFIFMWRPTAVSLGPLASQPIIMSVGDGKGLSLAPLMRGSDRLLPIHQLPFAREYLHTLEVRYVPAHTTADLWVSEYDRFIMSEGKGKDSAATWEVFVALLVGRTQIPRGESGHLDFSSVSTYLKYITSANRYRWHESSPPTRAVRTAAAAVGPSHLAPRLCGEHAQRILDYIHFAPANESLEDKMLKAGVWSQLCTGGRAIDISRLREDSFSWEDRVVKATYWRWTKSIRTTQHAKYAPTVEHIRSLIGEPPFTENQWRSWGLKNEGHPLGTYTASLANSKLKELSQGFSPHATTTSLRDHFHKELAKIFEEDADKMVRHTPHRSSNSLRSNYLNQRKITKKEVNRTRKTRLIKKRKNFREKKVRSERRRK